MSNRIFWGAYFGLLLILGVGSIPLYSAPGKSSSQKSPPFSLPGRSYYSRVFTTSDYSNQPQNWCIVQDARGIIYAANQGGVLEYDGTGWRTLPMPNRNVRSLAVGGDGILYVGGENEFGCFRPDSRGNLVFTSLSGSLESTVKNFGPVWKTHAAPDGIYFETSRRLFRWIPKSRTVTIWEPGYLFHNSFCHRGRIYMFNRDTGLMRIEDGALRPVQGTELLKGKRVFFLVSFGPEDDEMLIGTRDRGFFLLRDGRTVPFAAEAGELLAGKDLSHGVRLRDGSIALATLRAGLVIMGYNGSIIKRFDKSSGLPGNNIKYMFQEPGGNIWLATENGLCRIEYGSPLTFFSASSGLDNLVLSVVRHDGTLYAGTTSGLYRLSNNGMFKNTTGITSRCRWLLSSGDTLLTATDSGVFALKQNRRGHITERYKILDRTVYTLFPSPRGNRRVWAGTENGPVLLIRDNNLPWHIGKLPSSLSFPVLTIVEEPGGILWLGTSTYGVVRMDGTTVSDSPAVTRFTSAHGLPSGEINVFQAAGHVMFASNSGIYRFDSQNRRFIPDGTLDVSFADGTRGAFRIAEGPDRTVWVHSNVRDMRAVPLPGGGYKLDTVPFLRLPFSQSHCIYPDPDGRRVWLARSDGLVCFDSGIQKNYSRDFMALVRSVRFIHRDENIFSGFQADPPGELNRVLQYRDRHLRFNFSAAFYENESETLYRFYLEGNDAGWSTWSRETQKDYTNLDSGEYTFRVQAKNIYGHPSRIAVYRFRVTPPWFKTWWAVCLYTCALLLTVGGLVRLRSRKLSAEKKRLEQMVNSKTAEISEKNLQLERHSARLRDQSEKLAELDRVKSRFFANISHEFRTPLTLIMGPLESYLLSQSPEAATELGGNAATMLGNSHRLLHMVNQLLELSKFESGKMTLRATRTNINALVETAVAAFDSLAGNKGVQLTVQTGPEPCMTVFDREKVEQVLFNLLSNAVKFTPRDGRITVTQTIVPSGAAGEDFPDGCVEISVADTGPGIPAESLEHIFDRFYQATPAGTYRQKGSGIGLALTRELVRLHGGTIRVQSRTASDGKTPGTVFYVRFHLGDGHLLPGDIGAADSDETSRSPAFFIPPIDENTPGNSNEYETVCQSTSGETDRETILVVEDNNQMRRYIREALEPEFRVAGAADGEAGLIKAREIIPDLVISDIMMPGTIDGYELTRQIKNDINTSHIPVILLSARVTETGIVEGLNIGADDYITKPFNKRILIARIRNLIELRRQVQLKLSRQMMLQPGEISMTSTDEIFLKELQQTIETNLGNPEFNVEQLGKKLYMSRTSLYKKILALSGEPPAQFIRSYRLKRAAQLLKADAGNVTEVAFRVGFSSTAYFTKCFKEKFHQLPSSLLV